MVCDNLDWWNLCSDDSKNVLSWFKHHHKNTTTQTQFGSSKSPTQQHHHKHQHKTTNTKTLQYHSILQSTTSVLLQYYKVLLRTTKYYSSTTKYYSSTTKSTPVLLRTTKYYSSTTPYYKVQLQYANTTKYNTTTGFFHSNRTSLRPCSCQVAVRNDIRHGVRNYTRLCSWRSLQWHTTIKHHDTCIGHGRKHKASSTRISLWQPPIVSVLQVAWVPCSATA